VGAADSIGKRNRDIQQLAQRKPVPRQHLRKRTTFDQLHRDEVDAVRLLDGMDGDDVGVAEGGDGSGLTLETRPPLWIGCRFFRQDLEGDPALQLGVLGDIDLAHSTLAQGGHHLIVRESFSNHRHVPQTFNGS
jgi:hypothetical protein